MASRIVTLAASSAVIVIMLGIIPTAEQEIVAGTNATNTSAFSAIDTVSTSLVELTPLVVLVLAAGFALYATGVLGLLR
jgi:hypothetical protein